MPPLSELLAFTLDPWEIVLRGTVVYWSLFALFRFVLRRDVGALGIADVLLVVLIADASQSAMSGEGSSIGDGLLLVLVLAGWSWLLDVAAYRFEWLRRFAEPSPLPLVRHGRLLRSNLRREFMSIEELRAKLREQGVDELRHVRKATMESNGVISVIREPGAPEGGGHGRGHASPAHPAE